MRPLEIEQMTQRPMSVGEVLPVIHGLNWMSTVASEINRFFPTVLGYQFVVRERRVDPA